MRTVLLCLFIGVVIAEFNFVSIGDWGCVPIGGYHEQDEITVAKQLAKTATDLNSRFTLNTGDNFYYCGVHNVSDDMFQTTFENVFTESSLMTPWYGCLGNHDYGYPDSAMAQILYKSPNNDRWKIPNRYYYERLVFPNEVNISLVVLDSSPCQSPYTSNNPSGWDPCGSVIPGCPGCTFHENVIAQSCNEQYEWFTQISATIPQDDWKILMTHAPAMDIDNVDFIPLIQQVGFDMYINGHVHLLTYYTIDNQGTYITTGAGCMVRIKEDQVNSEWSPSSCTHYNQNHTCQVQFQQVIAGFTTHSFNSNFTQLTTRFMSYDGTMLYEVSTNKSSSSSSYSSSN